ncbi:hypothetical protein CEXT_324051 [Caerostris extrusa]|uniref:Vomeronasal type-1 receptor n=1 Tax=Caerostris extrusa TaxID=172846 RepID=A0AAV4V6P8_CAEEX|nr:hypothetical protein CEXT_324051 [Caerostris extrusa]
MNSTDVPSYSITQRYVCTFCLSCSSSLVVGNTLLVIKQLLSLNRRSFPKQGAFPQLWLQSLFAIVHLLSEYLWLYPRKVVISENGKCHSSVIRNGHQPVLTLFLVFSNDLSKLNVIVLPTAPHFQEAKVSAVTNGAIEVTCV